MQNVSNLFWQNEIIVTRIEPKTFPITNAIIADDRPELERVVKFAQIVNRAVKS